MNVYISSFFLSYLSIWICLVVYNLNSNDERMRWKFILLSKTHLINHILQCLCSVIYSACPQRHVSEGIQLSPCFSSLSLANDTCVDEGQNPNLDTNAPNHAIFLPLSCLAEFIYVACAFNSYAEQNLSSNSDRSGS